MGETPGRGPKLKKLLMRLYQVYEDPSELRIRHKQNDPGSMIDWVKRKYAPAKLDSYKNQLTLTAANWKDIIDFIGH